MRWRSEIDERVRRAADAVRVAPGEGSVVQACDGRIIGADDLASALLHQSWDDLTGVTSLDPRWQACAPDGSEVPGEQHPAMVTLATGEPVRGFVMGVEAPTPDDVGTFVWLEIDSDPLHDDDGLVLGVKTRFRDVSETPVGRRATQRLIQSYRQMAREASTQQERFRAMVESSSDVILEAGEGGLVTWASPSVRDVLGFEAEQLVGEPVIDLVHQLDRASAQERATSLVQAEETGGRDELRMRTVDGGWLWMSAVWQLMRGPQGERYGVLVSLRDVHADVQRREALAHMAHHDGLTGLLNRDSAYAWLRSELDLAHQHGKHVGVLYLDVDYFKAVNDTHGHGMGDKALASVAQALREAVREDDMVARAGGDEFVVALRSVPDRDSVERRARAVLEGVRALDPSGSDGLSVSIGLAVDDGRSDVDDLVQRADEALFRAKRAGRDRFSW